MGEISRGQLCSRLRKMICMLAALAAGWAMLSLGPSSASAQDDTRDLAKKLFGSGVQYYDKGDYERALQAFQEAFRLHPHPVVRLNMANCYDRLNKPIEAIFHFERFLDENKEGVNSTQRKEVEEALKRLRKKVGEVLLRVVPDGVSIRIDDAEQRISPVVEPVILVAGEHFIDARMEGYRPVRRSVNVAGGDTTEVTITMQTLEASAVAPVPVAAPAAEEQPPPPIEQPVQEPEAESVLPEEEPAERAEETDSIGKGTPVLIAGAATALLAVATTITGVMALGANADYDHLAGRDSLSKEERTDAEKTASRAEDLALATDVLLGATVVGAAVTAYFLFSGGQESETQDATAASAWVGPHGAGIAVTGSL
jgi:hypothetical protein